MRRSKRSCTGVPRPVDRAPSRVFLLSRAGGKHRSPPSRVRGRAEGCRLRRLSAPPPAAGACPAWLPRVPLDTGLTSSGGCGHASGSPRPDGWTCRPAVTKRGSWRAEPLFPSTARGERWGVGMEGHFRSYTPWTRAPAALGSGEPAASHSPALQPPTSSEPPRN